MSENFFRDRIAVLEEENVQLRSRLEHFENQQAQAAGVRKAIVGLGVQILSGPRLWASSRSWFEKLSQIETLRDLASPETADLTTAIVQRLMRVGIAGLLIAAFPVSLLLWQNLLIREQNATIQKQIDQQAGDALLVRRAQLLATIYDQECEGAESVSGSTSALGIEHIERAGYPESGSKVCRPRAHPRARRDAVLAFCEIERTRGVRPDLIRVDLSGGVFLDNVDLRETILSGANLQGAFLRGSDLRGAILSDADLRGAYLHGGVLLNEARLFRTDFRQANLQLAIFHGADLEGALFDGANLSWADLSTAKNLTPEQIDQAQGDARTTLPKDLKRPTHWPDEVKIR